MHIRSTITILLIGSFLVIACNNGPKVISPTTETETLEKSKKIFNPDPSIQITTDNNTSSFNDDLHKVVVNEILPATRYVYLHVSEGEEQFWIATRKKEIAKGKNYFYRGGLLKTNFESKEYNRMFKKIYLVSNLVAEDHAIHSANSNTPNPVDREETEPKENIPTHTEKNIEHKGTLTIAELVKNPKKYEGHTVQIHGECVKVNPNIIDRNWIHIKDGSKDDFDLVITSNIFIPEGTIVTMRAVVSLNRDFGAGYKYDLILENGTLVQ